MYVAVSRRAIDANAYVAAARGLLLLVDGCKSAVLTCDFLAGV